MNRAKLRNWILCFLAAYFTGFAIVTIHTIYNGVALGMFSTGSYYLAYEESLPFHPLYCTIIWPFFTLLYFRKSKTGSNQWKTALALGTGWTLLIIVLDLFGWVLIPHPFVLTFREFYLDSQPWITLAYLAIFVSPCIGMFIHKRMMRGSCP